MNGYGEYGSTAVWRDDQFFVAVWHLRTEPDGRDVYGWAIVADRTVVGHDRDHGTVRIAHPGQGGPPRAAMSTLLSFLCADAEAYAGAMRRGGREPVEGWVFSGDVAEWAYGVADELAMAAHSLSEDA